MVIEEFIKPKQVEKNPLLGILFGLILTISCISLSVIFFRENSALMGVVLVTVGSVPFLQTILNVELKKELQANTLMNLILRNKKIFIIYFVFFLGVATGYFLLYIFLPAEVSIQAFDTQKKIFGGTDINSLATQYFNFSLLDILLKNNIGIILLCFFLSFLYGAGAVLVLTWNASVLGIFLASLGKIHIAAIFFPHIFLEFSAYFLAAVSGGLISVVIDKYKFGTIESNKIALDSAILLLFSIIAVIAAGFIEVFVLTFL